jgi:hypothetical protein
MRYLKNILMSYAYYKVPQESPGLHHLINKIATLNPAKKRSNNNEWNGNKHDGYKHQQSIYTINPLQRFQQNFHGCLI